MANIDDLDLEEYEVVEDVPKQSLSIDDIAEEDIEEIGNEDVSTTEAALRGAAQGLAFNYADELIAGGKALVTDQTYDEALTETRQAFKDAQEAHPVAFTGSEIAGGMVGFGKIGMAAKGIKGVAALGAHGAINSLGLTEEDKLEEQFSDAFHGALLTAAGGTAIKGAMSGLGKLGKGLVEEGRGLAERAMGVFNKSSRRAFREMLDRKGIDADQFMDRLAAQTGVDGKPLLSGVKDQPQLLADVVAKKEFIGDEMGRVLKGIVDKNGDEIAVPSDSVMAAISEDITNKFTKDPSLFKWIDDAKKINTLLAAKAESSKTITPSELQLWKRNLMKMWRDDRDFAKLSEMETNVVKSLDDQIEMLVDTYGKGGKSLENFKALKQQYGTLAEANKFIAKSIDDDGRGLIGKLFKSVSWGNIALIGGLTGGYTGPMGMLIGAAMGAGLKTAAKSPGLQRSASKKLMKVGTYLEQNAGNTDIPQRLTVAATRGFTDFEDEIQRAEDHIDGKITSPEEAMELQTQVRSSGLSTRKKMEAMQQINNGFRPTVQDEPEDEFHKVYQSSKQKPGDRL